jgi:Uncharacterized protein conserved in bacteria
MKYVRVDDRFWNRYARLVREVMIPYQWEAMNDRVEGVEKSHAIANLRIAAGLETGDFYGYRFQDSDLAKWLEAVAYSLATHPDPALEELADGAIELLGEAQREDGYLNSYFAITGIEKRWTNERDSHETYVAGHMIEAAVAYFESTGKRAFLDIACKIADDMDATYGRAEGKRRGYPGHQIAEMALVRLYRATREERYLELAEYFLDERGREPYYFALEAAARGQASDKGKFGERMREYNQTHLPVREQRVAVGHAVRAVYMYAAMADIAFLRGDSGMRAACEALWEDVTRRQMSITGGIGQQEYWEGFSYDYDLPNDSTYNETCASVGLAFWASRMAALELRGDYCDQLERALYNGILSGVSLDGKRYFYVNLLESEPPSIKGRRDLDYSSPTRKGWFACACCPPNLARLVASIGGYIYGRDESSAAIYLYISSSTEMEISGTRVAIAIETDYPLSGKAVIEVDPERPARFSLRARIPGWCRSFEAEVAGERYSEAPDGYLIVDREWRRGDKLLVDLQMPVERIEAHPAVRADSGKVAIARGPLVYCLEEVDNGPHLSDICLEADPRFEERYESDLLGGVVAIYADASRKSWKSEGELYRGYEPERERIRIKAVPYYAWDNRGVNAMTVWIGQR